jgi:hypothetical protein
MQNSLPRDADRIVAAGGVLNDGSGLIIPLPIDPVTGRLQVTAIGGGSSSLVVGTTTITGATDGQILYSLGGVLQAETYTPGGVTSFNTRTGVVTLNSTDVTTALGYTPLASQFWSVNGSNNIYNNNSGGNVGIGTTTPQNRLDVQGGNASIYNTGASTHFTIGNIATGKTYLQLGTSADASGYNFIQTVSAVGSTYGNFALNPDGGNVGIGNTAPGYALDVTGDVNITGIYRIGTVPVISSQISLGNYYFGPSGNLTGTGGYNTAAGYNALSSNTSGQQNAAFGFQALLNNTSGQQNMAVGPLAMVSNTTGSYNVAVGMQALYFNTTGNSNTAVGTDAGLYASGYANNATSSSSVYIGNGTQAFANGDVDEIVIGNNAVGYGSHTVTLGSTSIATTVLQGNVGVGTASPNGRFGILSTSNNQQALSIINPLGNVILGLFNTSTNDLIFTMSDSTGSSPLIRLRVDGASSWVDVGNFGFGNAAPNTTVDVVRNTPGATDDYGLTSSSGAGTTSSGVTIGYNSAADYGIIYSRQRGTIAKGLLIGNPYSSTGLFVTESGSVGIGTTTPAARLHIAAGTSSAYSAPLKFTAGVNLTTPEDGSFEYDGTHLYFTIGSTRQIII